MYQILLVVKFVPIAVNKDFALIETLLKADRKNVAKKNNLKQCTHKLGGVLVRQGGLLIIAIRTYTFQTVFRAIVCFANNTIFLCYHFMEAIYHRNIRLKWLILATI